MYRFDFVQMVSNLSLWLLGNLAAILTWATLILVLAVMFLIVYDMLGDKPACMRCACLERLCADRKRFRCAVWALAIGAALCFIYPVSEAFSYRRESVDANLVSIRLEEDGSVTILHDSDSTSCCAPDRDCDVEECLYGCDCKE